MNLPADLQPGDILFYRPTSIEGIGIAVKTWTWLSHVECFVGHDQVAAARAEGTDFYPLRLDASLAYVRRPPATFDLADALQAIQPMMFQKYQTLGGFITFFDPWGRRQQQPTRICSSLATVFLRGGGCVVFNPEFPSADAAPAQLWQTPALATVWSEHE